MRRVIVVVTDFGYLLLAAVLLVIAFILYWNAHGELVQAAELANECQRPQYLIVENQDEQYGRWYNEQASTG